MFRDRDDAGRQVAVAVADLRSDSPVVLGLPRGGVPVAAVVAAALDAPLDIIVARKLGVPGQPEYALGAIAEDGVRVLDSRLVASLGLSLRDLVELEERERAELRRRVDVLRAVAAPLSLRDRVVLIVDDGVATGATVRAACRCAVARGAARVIVAVPCAPARMTAADLEADEVRVVESSAAFGAVGQFYAAFDQADDSTVVALLRAARSRTEAGGVS